MSLRVIFHIGQQKTGTTATQAVMRRDRERLETLGILYPDTGHDLGLRGNKHVDHNGIFKALCRGRSNTQTLEEIAGELAEQLDRVRPHTVVISSELAFMAADRRQQAPLDAFDRLFDTQVDVDVVAYLRRPDRYLTSYHQQLVRNGVRMDALHTKERFDHLEQTVQLDYVRALDEYRDHFGAVTVHRYEDAGDMVDHFYRTVLGHPPPDIEHRAANHGLPAIFVDLARDWTNRHQRMTWLQGQALVRYGNREAVDLLGPENRRRVHDRFVDQNRRLGESVGRDVFFDDLEAMLTVPEGSITPEEASSRYRPMFEALIAVPSVHEVRRQCLDLEARDRYFAAAQVFAANRGHLSDADVEWFRSELEHSTDGVYTVIDGEYRTATDGPVADREVEAAPRLAAARRRAARVRDQLSSRLGRRVSGA